MGTKQRGSRSLTEGEREALLTALEQGYFDETAHLPTPVLAVELGVSDAEAHERLRRGMAKLARANPCIVERFTER